jgi:hypothetical protein
MAKEQELSETNIPATISRKLEDLEIRSVRQLYSRLLRDSSNLQDYLQLTDIDFASFYRAVEGLVKDKYPDDILPRIHPAVKKTGVAAHRLNDPTRPKFDRRSKD